MSSARFAGILLESRRALRSLGRSPGFVIGTVLVLGVSIGSMATVATAAYELFLRPLPFPSSQQLVKPTGFARTMGFDVGLSPAMLVELEDDPALQGIAAFEETETVAGGQQGNWRAARMTVNLTGVMGVSPLLGRAFAEEDGKPGASPAALLTERAWRRRFGADPRIVGREVRLDDRPVRVVGVLPGHFTVPTPDAEIITPLVFDPQQTAPQSINEFIGLDVVARLEPGVTAATFLQRLEARYTGDPRLQPMIELAGLEFRVTPLQQAWTERHREPLFVLSAAVLMVLAAAALNLAGLWMARILGRGHEQAVQVALGARRWRVMWLEITEFLLLGAAGVFLALMLAPIGLRWLAALNVIDEELPIAVGAGPVTLAIAVGVLLLSAIPVVVGVWWQSRHQHARVSGYLASGAPMARGLSARGRRFLLITQLALAMSLLSVVALLLRSWHGLLTTDLGFDPNRLLVAGIYATGLPPSQAEESDPRVAAAIERLRAIPGVEAVTHANVTPFSRSESVTSYVPPSREPEEASVRMREVGEAFFSVAGMRVLRGRDFGPEDYAKGSDAVIVDEHFARSNFPGTDALGERFRLSEAGRGYRTVTVVGVVATAKHQSPDESTDIGAVYQPRLQPAPAAMLLMSTSVPPAHLSASVRQALSRELGEKRIGNIATMEQLVRRTVRDREPQIILLGVFAVVTVSLAGIGLFALLAYTVRARTAEFGLRMAVGADRRRIRGHVLGEGLRLLVPGIVLGAGTAWLAAGLVAAQLYGIEPADPVTWLICAAFLCVVTLLAGAVPARRAARIQPTEALRYE